MQVLQESVTEHVSVGCHPDDGRNVIQAGALARPPTPFAHHQLVAAAPEVAHHDWLQQADLGDGCGELLERLLVKGLPWLTRIRRNGVDRDLFEIRPSYRPEPSVATIAGGCASQGRPPVVGPLASTVRRVGRAGGVASESATTHSRAARRTGAGCFRD